MLSFRKRKLVACSAALVVSVLAVYGQVARGLSPLYPGERFDFIAIDDNDYLAENPWVRQGLSLAGVQWAFTATHAGNWHPLTWLSLMLDVELFGPGPAGPHLTNLLLHLANVLLLFAFLLRATARLGPSLLAAALWAVHPLHAESVAWVSERKDVLSTCFALGALLAYERYARRPSLGSYALVGLALTLSLLAKQMWVTLPALLWLLDFWPLGRMMRTELPGVRQGYSRPGAMRLVGEKLPLLALAAAFSVMIFLVQRNAGAVSDLEAVSLDARLRNVVVSYWMYLYKTFWPAGLAVFYPRPVQPHAWSAVLACAAPLVAITATAIAGWRRWPWLLVGWFWYLMALVPVIGLVQIGSHAWADRYAYVPHMGLFVALAWSADACLARWRAASAARHVVPLAAVAAGGCVLALAVAGHRQVALWQNTERLLAHALRATDHHYPLALTLAGHLATQGELTKAEAVYQAILDREPGDLKARLDCAAVLAAQARFDEAARMLEEAVQLHPDDADAHHRLAGIRLAQGDLARAVQGYERARRLRPDWAAPYNDLAWILATEASQQAPPGVDALEFALHASRLTGRQDPSVLDTLAAAYANAADWENAVATAAEAVELARRQQNPALADEVAARLHLYRQQRPYRASPE